MITITNYKPAGLSFFCIAIVLSALTACNSATDADAKNSAMNADSASVKASTDSVAAKTAAKVKKGKATAMMAMNSKMKVEKGTDGVYTVAEKMPEFPGGDEALSKYVSDNISYPQDALDQNKEGTVKVSFVVDEKGMATDPMVTDKNAGQSLDNEAVRVVKQMPAWKPGTVKGKNVKTRLELPITFKLADS